MIGTTLSHYRIVEELGRGGMGVVYLAEDSRLRRQIALKVLPEELMRDSLRRRRFLQEARAAAAIADSHLVAIHDIDEDKGLTFIAMEYIRGKSVKRLIREQELSTVDAVRIAAEVAEAIGKVHMMGIVHRDLKPDNILITEDGQAKVIDFGLAKLLEPTQSKSPIPTSSDDATSTETNLETKVGVVIGTVRYMSPEQACGSPLDARSDVFSLGVVLFEMLTGNPLFKRPTPLETLSSILHEDPPELRQLKSKSPSKLEVVVRRALSKSPQDRYQTAGDMAAELRQIHDRLTRGTKPVVLFAAAIAMIVLSVAVVVWSVISIPERIPPEPTPLVSVLIADFDNLTGEAVFDGAVEQALTIGLEGAPFITTFNRAEARVRAARIAGGSDGPLDTQRAQLVCVSEGIKVAIVGSIDEAGAGYEIHATALNPVGSVTIAEVSRTAATKDKILGVMDSVARELRARLGETATRNPNDLVRETFTSSSLEAVSVYAKGQQLLSLGRYRSAAEEFKKAIVLDPDLGRAYSSLAVVMANTGNISQAESYFATALSLIDRMTERERLRTRGSYYLASMNYENAIDEYSNLVQKYPADSSGRSNLALAYFYARDMERALTHGRQAADIYPKSVPRRNNVALYAMYASDFDSADEEARHALDLNPDYEKAHLALALSQLGRSQIQEARETYHRLENTGPRGATLASLGLADMALFEGQADQARRLLESSVDQELEGDSPTTRARKLVTLAESHLELGNTERALEAAQLATELSQQFGVLFSAARVHVDAGAVDVATSLASSLASRLQSDARAYARVIEGELLLASNNYHGAISAFRGAQEIADTWYGRFGLGRAFLAVGAPAEAHSELEECFERRGEATALFLDEIPTYRLLPQVHYYLGLALEGMQSAAATESFATYLDIRGQSDTDPHLDDARGRIESGQ